MHTKVDEKCFYSVKLIHFVEFSLCLRSTFFKKWKHLTDEIWERIQSIFSPLQLAQYIWRTSSDNILVFIFQELQTNIEKKKKKKTMNLFTLSF